MALVVDKSGGARPLFRALVADANVPVLTGNFTIEVWVTFSADATGTILAHWNATGNQRSWIINYNATTDILQFAASTNGSTSVALTTTFVPTLSQEYAVAADRSGTTVRFYVDGSVVDTDTVTGSLHNSTANMGIGHLNSADDVSGTIRAVRVTNGKARYAGAYTPPTLPLPAS